MLLLLGIILLNQSVLNHYMLNGLYQNSTHEFCHLSMDLLEHLKNQFLIDTAFNQSTDCHK